MEEQMTFEFEKRKPIKGYPELHWTGKRPYTSTQYYPAPVSYTHLDVYKRQIFTKVIT